MKTGFLMAIWSAFDAPTNTWIPSTEDLMSLNLNLTNSAARSIALSPKATSAAFLNLKNGLRFGGRDVHSLSASTGKGSRSRGQLLDLAASRSALSTALDTKWEFVGSGRPLSVWRCLITVMKVLRDEILAGVWCRSAMKAKTVSTEAGSWGNCLDTQKLANWDQSPPYFLCVAGVRAADIRRLMMCWSSSLSLPESSPPRTSTRGSSTAPRNPMDLAGTPWTAGARARRPGL